MKEKLLFQLTNAGNPFIYVEDANFENRGELLLVHDHQGMDLRSDYAREVMKSLVRVWKRPVNVTTTAEGKPVMLCLYDAPFPEPLARARPLAAAFAVGLVLVPEPSGRELMRIEIGYCAAACDPDLEAPLQPPNVHFVPLPPLLGDVTYERFACLPQVVVDASLLRAALLLFGLGACQSTQDDLEGSGPSPLRCLR